MEPTEVREVLGQPRVSREQGLPDRADNTGLYHKIFAVNEQ
ncbi:hypothetical protein [Novosphingobium sp. BL-8A]